MKTTTALYVREDGEILIGEFAEDCKESEVKNTPVTKCADQQQALQLIQKHFYEGYNCKIVPDLYPIEGIRYEVREEVIQKADRIKCGCPCHIHTDITHVVECCENGYVELPEWKEKLAHIITPVVEDEEIENTSNHTEFLRWFKENEMIFHQSQFTDRDMCYRAWVDSRKSVEKAEDQEELWKEAEQTFFTHENSHAVLMKQFTITRKKV